MKRLLEILVRYFEFLYGDPAYRMVDSGVAPDHPFAWLTLEGPTMRWRLENERDQVVLWWSATSAPSNGPWFWSTLLQQMLDGGPEIVATLTPSHVEWIRANVGRIAQLVADTDATTATYRALADLMKANADARWGPIPSAPNPVD